MRTFKSYLSPNYRRIAYKARYSFGGASPLKSQTLNMGLAETDVVIDQTIYAKAVKVLRNPAHKHLKDFIVL